MMGPRVVVMVTIITPTCTHGGPCGPHPVKLCILPPQRIRGEGSVYKLVPLGEGSVYELVPLGGGVSV